MSSVRFEAVLVPRKAHRRLVLSSGCAALLIGTILILSLPAVAFLKTAFGCVWILSGAAELTRYRRAMSRIDRIRMDADGGVDGFDRTGNRYPLRLLAGSIMLERAAWFRLRFGDGLDYGELMTGNAATSEQWRRLQLIWRQHASTFGRLPGS